MVAPEISKDVLLAHSVFADFVAFLDEVVNVEVFAIWHGLTGRFMGNLADDVKQAGEIGVQIARELGINDPIAGLEVVFRPQQRMIIRCEFYPADVPPRLRALIRDFAEYEVSLRTGCVVPAEKRADSD
ncbi:MAG: hypothetical protein JNM52_00220 [Betaproteobacteria bacterium]|nr:hypothetical protein [Betaproteobacteria bacterium]